MGSAKKKTKMTQKRMDGSATRLSGIVLSVSQKKKNRIRAINALRGVIVLQREGNRVAKTILTVVSVVYVFIGKVMKKETLNAVVNGINK